MSLPFLKVERDRDAQMLFWRRRKILKAESRGSEKPCSCERNWCVRRMETSPVGLESRGQAWELRLRGCRGDGGQVTWWGLSHTTKSVDSGADGWGEKYTQESFKPGSATTIFVGEQITEKVMRRIIKGKDTGGEWLSRWQQWFYESNRKAFLL